MAKNKKRVTYKTYKKRFEKIMAQDKPQVYRSGKFVDVPGSKNLDYWKQCYSSTDRIRRKYPRYLFISKAGDIISVYGGSGSKTYPRLLCDELTDGRISHKFSVNGKSRAQMAHITSAFVFGAKRYGKSNSILEKKGFDALRDREVNVHHEKGYRKFPETQADKEFNNNVEYLEFVTVPIHNAIHKIPPQDASLTWQGEYMKMIAQINEDPRGSVIEDSGKGTIDSWPNCIKQKLPYLEKDGYLIVVLNNNLVDAISDGSVGKTAIEDLENGLIFYCEQQQLQPGSTTSVNTPKLGTFWIYKENT